MKQAERYRHDSSSHSMVLASCSHRGLSRPPSVDLRSGRRTMFLPLPCSPSRSGRSPVMARQVRVAVQTMPRCPAIAGRDASGRAADWCEELPLLVGARVSLRELSRRRCAGAGRQPEYARGPAVHRAAAEHDRDLRELHRVGAVRARARALRLLRRRAARHVRADRGVPAAAGGGRVHDR